MKHKYVMIVNR